MTADARLNLENNAIPVMPDARFATNKERCRFESLRAWDDSEVKPKAAADCPQGKAGRKNNPRREPDGFMSPEERRACPKLPKTF